MEFHYDSARSIHKVPFARFEDHAAPEFEDSNIFRLLAETTYVCGDSRLDCDMNRSGPVFANLKGDYEYLQRWYHNPHRKSNTRHGSHIMLYLIEGSYMWKLSETFVTKLLSTPSNITDLFDFG